MQIYSLIAHFYFTYLNDFLKFHFSYLFYKHSFMNVHSYEHGRASCWVLLAIIGWFCSQVLSHLAAFFPSLSFFVQMKLKEKMQSVSRRRKTGYLKNKTKTTKTQNHKPRLTANASALKEIGKRGLPSKQTVSTGKLLEITDLRGNEN